MQHVIYFLIQIKLNTTVSLIFLLYGAKYGFEYVEKAIHHNILTLDEAKTSGSSFRLGDKL